jgi:hypothetical protein
MEFVKFNRVAPIVVDAPESIRTESNYGKIALEDFDEITTYSKMSRIFVSWTSATLSPVNSR